jgi:xanthine/CO dehydrogenase XdhC/CoxF family maturation factor
VIAPRPEVIAVGGVHIAIALAQLTKVLGYRTTVVMLSHDPKLDDPALKIALPSPAFYVGALGSRVTQEQRR